MKFDFDCLPEDARKVLTALRSKNLRFWLVGGFVRDWVAGLVDYRDIDIAINAGVYKIRRIAGGEIIRCRFPHVLLHNLELLPCENIETSLKSRDFACNAIAIDDRGCLIDPFCGISDARNGIFRMISQDSFRDDPIRILRVCRLAARLDWKLDGQTRQALALTARKLQWGEFVAHYGLKIAVELKKVFEDANPSRFFRMIHNEGALHLVMPFLATHFASWQGPDEILARCDAAPIGNMVLRTWELMACSESRKRDAAKKAASHIRDYLHAIFWDTVASDFGRHEPLASSDMLCFMLRFGGQPVETDRDIIALARAAAPIRLTFRRFVKLKKRLLGHNLLPAKTAKQQARLLRLGEDLSVSPEIRLAVLRFYGFSKSGARRKIRQSGQELKNFRTM